MAWGLDNNLTRKVSLSDPLQIVQFKGLIAGPFLLGLGLVAGDRPPGATIDWALSRVILFLREPLTVQLLAAGLPMGVGVWLHLMKSMSTNMSPWSTRMLTCTTSTISMSICLVIPRRTACACASASSDEAPTSACTGHASSAPSLRLPATTSDAAGVNR